MENTFSGFEVANGQFRQLLGKGPHNGAGQMGAVNRFVGGPPVGPAEWGGRVLPRVAKQHP